MKTLRSIPKQEILVSLLLFGKAYLSRPTWFRDAEFPELEKFQSEDLIDWIPDARYVSAFDSLNWLLTKFESLTSIADISETLSLGLNDRTPPDWMSAFPDIYHQELEREVFLSELSHDIKFAFEKLFYVSPLLNGNVRHLGYNSSDPIKSLVNGASSLPPWSPFPLDDYAPGQVLGKQEEAFKAFDRMYGSFWGWLNEARIREYDLDFAAASETALVLDGAMSSIAAERFASLSSLPLKTSGRANSLVTPNTVLGDEAYQLLKVQFHDLRYPVIESVEDVLRLRDDPHLKTYRAIIAEYSERLRQELEDGRPRAIEKFRSDIMVALKSLEATKRWSKIVDWSFYISLPLVVIGSLYGLPLSDILTIPLTSYAKFVAHQKRKELDWILFGRH